MNTQSGSQIDGWRHYGFLKTNRFYNGVSGDDIRAPGSTVLGIDRAAKRGIAGRGVLVDFLVRPPATPRD